MKRRKFIASAAFAGIAGSLRPAVVIAESARKSTGFYRVHQFIDDHPDAVFIMRTDVENKTDEDDIRAAGRKFAGEVIVPSDELGIPVSHLVPIKPNITGGGGNEWSTMGIITDPNFVEGVVQSMKSLGVSRKKFHIREVNCINWEKHAYWPSVKRQGIDLHNMNQRVHGVDNSLLSNWSKNKDEIDPEELVWVDVDDGVVYRKIPYLQPINAPDTFLLNIAKFKAHSMGLTLACKNFQGAVGNGYQHFCQKFASVWTMLPEHRNPNVEEEINQYLSRHVNTLPRWDRPIKNEDAPDRTAVDRYDVLCQEIWSHRTIDSLSVTDFGLHIVEGVYGRDGNFGPGPNPEGNENNPHGKAWDYMTNIIIFGKNPYHVDLVGKWLGGHEPGNFGFFHIAMERGKLDILDPRRIPVYDWHHGRAARKPLDWFTRTPLKTFYLQRNYAGQNEPYWHLVNEHFDYKTVTQRTAAEPERQGIRILETVRQTRSNDLLAIEYAVPYKGYVQLEIEDTNGNTVDLLENAVRERGWHLTAWDTALHDSGEYAVRYRYNGRSEVRRINLKKS